LPSRWKRGKKASFIATSLVPVKRGEGAVLQAKDREKEDLEGERGVAITYEGKGAFCSQAGDSCSSGNEGKKREEDPGGRSVKLSTTIGLGGKERGRHM